MKIRRAYHNKIILFLFLFYSQIFTQQNLTPLDKASHQKEGFPIVLENDTLFFLFSGIGPFTAEKRANEISSQLNKIAEADTFIVDSIRVLFRNGDAFIQYRSSIILVVTPEDASANGKSIEELSNEYTSIIKKNILNIKEEYSQNNIVKKFMYISAFIIGFILLMWLSRLIFPKIYSFLERMENKIFKSVKIGKYNILKGSALLDLTTIIVKGLRLFITLSAIYFLLVFIVTNLPWTKHWYIQPILRGILLFIFATVVASVLLKGVNALYNFFIQKFSDWKGSLIKSFRFKSIEILSEEKAVDLLELIAKVVRITLWIILAYFYITLVFSFFSFSQTWASKLIDYFLGPLNTVVMSIVNFLPNLFFIIVIVIVFNYLLRLVKYIFDEIEKDNLKLPGFYLDWASPTYKIIKFLIIVLAVIIIFPYLPGSQSDAFKGVSVFLGVLFSLGSSSAISNIVAGTVLTYMRPFKLGDRVKIADTIGDVIEKTLLVTRIRTIKNVDVSIPNSMILGSHIINYSSVSLDKGLILHTTVTIGYDVPWKQVHQLLISAALETENIKQEPYPFVLQTSLDDFYVSYEINAYTNQPGVMAATYSKLHSNIQDKFNEAGVEIMSPHYGAMRDGNQITIPNDYLSKEYQTPSFRLFGVDIIGKHPKQKD